MKLTTLDPILLIEQHMSNSKMILKESCDGMTRDQRTIVENIYNEMLPLIEASLNPSQINQLFTGIEQSSTASGNNRTMLGKGVDTASKANEIINNVGKWLQDTTPVKMADQKFEQLKVKVSQKFPDLSDQLTGLGSWMKQNPGKSAAVIGVLTTLASLAGGPIGGAIAGQVLRGTSELLKGEKLSTAVGKGMKTAALGWLTGKAVELIGSAISKPIEIIADKMDPTVASASFNRTIREIGGKLGDRFETFDTGPLVGRKEDVEDILNVYKNAVDSWKSGDYMRADAMFKSAAEMTAKIDSNEYMISLALDQAKAAEVADAAKNTANFFSQMASVAQGAATGLASNEKKESYYTQDRPLSEGQVYMVFNTLEQLTEGPMLDKLKGMAGRAAGAVVQKASQVGTNLTTKITADKLNKAWRAAGSPTDSEELAKFLTKQGVDASIIKSAYASMKLPAPGATPVNVSPQQEVTPSLYLQVKSDLDKLDSKGKKRLAAYIQKQLGII